jgi:hypothetical protein
MSTPYVVSTETSSSAQFGDLMTLQKVAAAKTFAKDRMTEFQQNLNEGSWSLRMLALLGALAMIVVSILGVVNDILGLNTVSAIFGIYSLLFGVLIIVLEYGKQLFCVARLESGLYKNAQFLKYVWGRGYLIFFAGTLELAQNDVINIVVGVYGCVVGILFVVVGRSAAKKLAQARRSKYSPDEIHKMFDIADNDSIGSLNADQFANLTRQLGMDLTRREVESSFEQLGEDKKGRVNYENVLLWWNNEATETDEFSFSIV